MTTPFPAGGRSGGCTKPIGIAIAGFFVFIGLVTACGPETIETEVETTVTVTATADNITTTVTEEVTVTATEAITVEAAADPPPAPEPAADTVMRGFVGGGAAAPASASTYYANCSAVRAAGAAPLYAGSPGYSSKLDRDGDGVACEN